MAKLTLYAVMLLAAFGFPPSIGFQSSAATERLTSDASTITWPRWQPWTSLGPYISQTAPGWNPTLTNYAGSAALLFDSRNRLHTLLGGDATDAYEARASHGFSPGFQLAATPLQYYVSMCIDKNDVLHAFGTLSTGPMPTGNGDVVYRKRDASGWSQETVISQPSPDPSHPWNHYLSENCAAVAPDGTVHVIAYRYDTGPQTWSLVHMVPGSTYEVISDGPSPNYTLTPYSLTGGDWIWYWFDIDLTGTITVYWNSRDNIAWRGALLRSFGGKGSWSIPVEPGVDDLWDSTAYDSQGNRHRVRYGNGSTPEPPGFSYQVNTGPITFVPIPGNGFSFYPKILIDSRDQVHILGINYAPGTALNGLFLASRLRNPDPASLNPQFRIVGDTIPANAIRFRDGTVALQNSPSPGSPGIWYAAMSKTDQIHVSVWGYYTRTLDYGTGVRDGAAMVATLPGGAANVVSGNHFCTIPLFGTSGVGPSQGCQLIYNSLDSYNGFISPGWRLNYEMYLVDHARWVNQPSTRHFYGSTPEPQEAITVYMGDGRPILFTFRPFFPTDPSYGDLVADDEYGYFGSIRRSSYTAFPMEYTLTTKTGMQYIFNTSGKLRRILDPYGNYLDVVYDSNGRLAQIVDMLGNGGIGRTTNLTYEPQVDQRYPPRLLSITDPNQSVYQLGYTGKHLSSVQFASVPGTPTYQFTYTPAPTGPPPSERADLLMDFILPRGNAWSSQYLPDGRILETRDPQLVPVTFSFDESTPGANPRKTDVLDRRGFPTRYKVDAGRFLVQEIDDPDVLASTPGITPVLRTFDQWGNLTFLQDRWGSTTEFRYIYYYGDAVFPIWVKDLLIEVWRPTASGTGTELSQSYTYTSDFYCQLQSSTVYATPPGGTQVETFTTTYNNFLDRIVHINFPDVTRPDGTVQTGVRASRYGVGPRRQPTETTNEEGLTTHFSNFDPVHGLPQTILRDGDTQPTLITYDPMGRRATLQLPQGDAGNDPPGLISWVYDGMGRLESFTDAGGKLTSYGYDLDSNPNLVIPPVGGQTSTGYDALGYVSGGTNPDGSWSQTADSYGNVVSSTNIRGYTSSFHYDGLCRVMDSTIPGGTTTTGGGGGPPQVTQYGYDQFDGTDHFATRTEVGSPSNRVTKTTFDRRGRAKSVLFPDSNTRSDFFYNEADELVASQTSYNGAVQTCSVNFRDARRRVDHVTTQGVSYGTIPGSDQLTRFYLYNRVGSLVQYVDPLGDVTTPSSLSHKVAYNRDTRDRVQSIVDGKGVAVAQFTFGDDDLPSQIQVPDPVSKTSTLVVGETRSYSSRKELKSRLNANGKGITCTYGTLPAQIDTVTDGLGNQTKTLYDGTTQRPNQVAEGWQSPNERDTFYGWTNGLLTSVGVFDPTPGAMTSATHLYTYDQANRLELYQPPIVPQTPLAPKQFFYTEFGDCYQTVEGQKTITHTLDPLGQATQSTWSGAYTNQLSRSFNGLGQLTSITDPASTRVNQMDYDVWRGTPATETLNKVDGTTTSTIKSQTHSYDFAGNYIGLSDPENGSHGWLVDENNRITNIQYANLDVGIIKYTPGGLIDTLTRYSSQGTALPPIATTTYTYDSLGRLLEAQTLAGDNTTVLADIAWTYYDNDLVKTISSLGITDTITYNQRNEVIGETITGAVSHTITYVLDPAGNRSQVTLDGVMTTFTYNAASQLVTETWPAQTISHVYDPFGNETSRTSAPQGAAPTTEAYSYNFMNLLATYTNSLTGANWQYAYWPNGDRYSKTDLNSSNATIFCNRFSDVVTEYDQTGALLNSYVQATGLDQKHTRIAAGGARTHYLGDQVGTLSAIFDDTGALLNTGLMDVFGNTQLSGGIATERYGFAQRELDSESGLVYMRNRLYDPRVGRFTQNDPIFGNKPFAHYVYASNNPVSRIDPLGLGDEDKDKPGTHTVILRNTSQVEGTELSTHAVMLASDPAYAKAFAPTPTEHSWTVKARQLQDDLRDFPPKSIIGEWIVRETKEGRIDALETGDMQKYARMVNSNVQHSYLGFNMGMLVATLGASAPTTAETIATFLTETGAFGTGYRGSYIPLPGTWRTFPRDAFGRFPSVNAAGTFGSDSVRHRNPVSFAELLEEAGPTGRTMSVRRFPDVYRGGRLGTDETRQQVYDIGTELESRGWKITGGGGRLDEEFIPGQGPGIRGGSFVDITATKSGRTLRINTITTELDGRTPTYTEFINAQRIRRQCGGHLLLVPKER